MLPLKNSGTPETSSVSSSPAQKIPITTVCPHRRLFSPVFRLPVSPAHHFSYAFILFGTSAVDVLLSLHTLCGHGVLIYTNKTGNPLIRTLLCSITSDQKPHRVSLTRLLLILYLALVAHNCVKSRARQTQTLL